MGEETFKLIKVTGDIVSAYITNNRLSSADQVSELIKKIFDDLSNIACSNAVSDSNMRPAVPISESVQPDYIVCLEDGKKLKMLKRHLKTAYHMSLVEYRVKWGLPSDYPSVAPNYRIVRSNLARGSRLGYSEKKGRKSEVKV